MLIVLIGNSAQSVLSFRASLVRRLVERGHEIHAFAPDYTPDTAARVRALGARPVDYALQRSGIGPWSEARTVLDLSRRLRREPPQAVLCYFIKPAVYGTLAAALAGVPRRVVMLEGLGYGFVTDNDAPFRRRMITAAMKRLLRFALARAHQTVVLNRDDLDVVVGELAVPTDQAINMGGIGVDLDLFQPAAVRDRAQVFALAARLITEKGVRQYVEAARRIKPHHPDTRFLLLGEIDDNPESLTAAEVSGWVKEGLIEWPGRVADIQAWLKRCDVFVLPSYYREGVPRSIQEAMALGRAIVTTDHVGCRDTVVSGVNGYLVPPKNVDRLVQVMTQLIEEHGLARRMGAASRRLAEERFDAKRADGILVKMLEQ